jgi:hypothetical protein
VKSAYEIAKNGGKHEGFYRNNRDLPAAMLERGIGSMEKRLADHRAWIADPYIKLPYDADPRQVAALVSKKWPGDIARIEEEMGILQGILQEKGEIR